MVLEEGGSFKLTPTSGYNGAASFTYRFYDGLEQSIRILVTIQVGGVGTYLPFIRKSIFITTCLLMINRQLPASKKEYRNIGR